MMSNGTRFVLVLSASLGLGGAGLLLLILLSPAARVPPIMLVACFALAFLTLCALAPWRDEP